MVSYRGRTTRRLPCQCAARTQQIANCRIDQRSVKVVTAASVWQRRSQTGNQNAYDRILKPNVRLCAVVAALLTTQCPGWFILLVESGFGGEVRNRKATSPASCHEPNRTGSPSGGRKRDNRRRPKGGNREGGAKNLFGSQIDKPRHFSNTPRHHEIYCHGICDVFVGRHGGPSRFHL